MKQKLTEMFDLEFIRRFAEDNIDFSDRTEEDCGETRRILVIETLVSGSQGAYIPGLVLDLFGRAEGFDIVDPYNYDKNETIHEALMFLENEINDALNELLPSSGRYYVGYHEYDGSYCLFYEEEYGEEAAEMERVYRLAVYEIVNFDVIDTLEEAEFELVEVIEGATPEECVQKAAVAYDMDRFGWTYAD